MKGWKAPSPWFRRSNIPVAGRETPLCTQFGWAQALGSTSLGVYWLKFPTGAFPVDSARKNGCTMKTGGKGQCTSQDSGDWGFLQRSGADSSRRAGLRGSCFLGAGGREERERAESGGGGKLRRNRRFPTYAGDGGAARRQSFGPYREHRRRVDVPFPTLCAVRRLGNGSRGVQRGTGERPKGNGFFGGAKLLGVGSRGGGPRFRNGHSQRFRGGGRFRRR